MCRPFPFVIIVVSLCAATPARADDWAELGSDCEQTRQSAEQSGPTFEPLWTYALASGQIIAAPVTSGGKVVIAGAGGTVAALGARDGTPIWTRALAGGVRATPTIIDGRVVLPTMEGALYALRTFDGSIAWQRTFGGQNYSSPQLIVGPAPDARPTLVVAGGFPAQDVWRFDALTGAPVWQTPKGAIPALVYSSAAVAGTRLVIGMNGGRLQSLDLASGTPSWKLDASGPVYLSSPLVASGGVYFFPADQGVHLYGVDADTGAALPGFPVAIPDLSPVAGAQPFGQGPAVSSPMISGGLIVVQVRRQDYVTSGRTTTVFLREAVVAIDPRAAAVRWQHPLANAVASNTNDVPELGLCATPAGFSNAQGAFVAVSSSLTGRVAVLDVATGQERWAASLTAPGRSSPVFSNGELLVATDDSRLAVFGSTSNHAPTAPSDVSPSGATAFASSGTVVTWTAGSDADDDLLSYVVAFQEQDAPETRVERTTSPGELRAVLPLAAGKSYVLAVRSRDAQGALSPWSTPQRLQLGVDDTGGAASPPVSPPAAAAGTGDAAAPPGDQPGMPPPPSSSMTPLATAPGTPAAPAPSPGAPDRTTAPVGPMPSSTTYGSTGDARDGSVDDAQDASSADGAPRSPETEAAHWTSAGGPADLAPGGCSVAEIGGLRWPWVLMATLLLFRRRRR